MQTYYFEINDINTLKEIKFNYEVNSVFPDILFKHLVDSSSNTVGLLLEILEHFLNSSAFWQNRGNSLCYTIEFVLTNISYFTKNKNNFILYKLIEFLNKIFVGIKGAPAINLGLDTCRICDLIVPLLKNDQLKYSSVTLLTSMLSIQEIIFRDFGIVDHCISQCFNCLESECKELPVLVVASLRAFPRLLLSKSNVLYHWLYRDCPQLLEKSATRVLLNCIILAYETKDKANYELTNVYKHKISTFYGMLKNKMFYRNIITIFCYMINDFTSLGVLPMISIMGINGMKFEINEEHYWFYDNTIIIINYLRCLYCSNEIDREDIRKCIVSRCLKPPYPPSILKCLCLLYPLFCQSQKRNITDVSAENSVLDAAEQCNYFCEILTYHLLQLQWFLSSNRPILKANALGAYLVNCKSDRIILGALKATSTTELLVNWLYDDTKVAERAVDLLSQLKCPRTSIFLKQKLPTSIQSQTSLGRFFKAKPALPDSEKEGVFFCEMMSSILRVLNERDAFVGTCEYSSRLLSKFKNCSQAIKVFILNEYCVVRMYDAASNSDEEVALSAITMLIIFVKLQRRHLIKMVKSTPIDFRNLLQGSDIRLLRTVNLLSLFPSYSTPKYCAEIYSQILVILVKLQRTYPFLAYLSSTMLYVELHSCFSYKTESQIQQFLIFLEDWLERMAKEGICLYDISQNINSFLLSLPQSCQVQRNLKLLRKCAEYP